MSRLINGLATAVLAAGLLASCGSTHASVGGATAKPSTATTSTTSVQQAISKFKTPVMVGATPLDLLSPPSPFGSGVLALSSSSGSITLDYVSSAGPKILRAVPLESSNTALASTTSTVFGPAVIGNTAWIATADRLISVGLGSFKQTLNSPLNGFATTPAGIVATPGSVWVVGDASSFGSNPSDGILMQRYAVSDGTLLSSTYLPGVQVQSEVLGQGEIWITTQTAGHGTTPPQVQTLEFDPATGRLKNSFVVSKQAAFGLMVATTQRLWGSLDSYIALVPPSFVTVDLASKINAVKVPGVVGEILDANVDPNGQVVWAIGPSALFEIASTSDKVLQAWNLSGLFATTVVSQGGGIIWVFGHSRLSELRVSQ